LGRIFRVRCNSARRHQHNNAKGVQTEKKH
jgi:hypothetical protein